ncbi:DUF397 domain-containing protein [Streptomyces halstedii]|uniref:DUF397 domain-containing protein n=1 Tax=Streptomyces TaxID=1883 RepID=UPI0004A8BA7C|nr:DUF397 domain-containing protein [Streptomyces sp. NTK 937]KDQ68936.1 toxin [Streptomyces sp. NTK 937]KDQ68938.1 toxin [Streptomyces sp. NTK 937]KDQ68940.1 toxin [Streptomyces sp. NTK 937]
MSVKPSPSTVSAHELTWVKSSHSDSSDPSDCVEVATASSTVHVRDSKNAAGPRFAVAGPAWTRFVAYAALTPRLRSCEGDT